VYTRKNGADAYDEKRTGFQCDLPASGLSLVSTKCVNQDILDKVGAAYLLLVQILTDFHQLQELKELYDTKPGDDDHWRSFSYSKGLISSFFSQSLSLTLNHAVIRTLPHVKARITTLEDALSIPGVGQKTAQKARSFSHCVAHVSS
jgi:hypothetical protein